MFFGFSRPKFLFEVKSGLLRLIEESKQLSAVTSNIVDHSFGSKAFFTAKNYFAVQMTIPQNQLLLWPGCVGSDSTSAVLLPQNNSVFKQAVLFSVDFLILLILSVQGCTNRSK